MSKDINELLDRYQECSEELTVDEFLKREFIENGYSTKEAETIVGELRTTLESVNHYNEEIQIHRKENGNIKGWLSRFLGNVFGGKKKEEADIFNMILEDENQKLNSDDLNSRKILPKNLEDNVRRTTNYGVLEKKLNEGVIIEEDNYYDE